MCQKVQTVTHNGMHKCFSMIAQLHLRWNKLICLIFVAFYIGVSKYNLFHTNVNLGFNLANFAEYENQD